MEKIRLTRTEELEITHNDVQAAVQDAVDDNGLNPSELPEINDLIDMVINRASEFELNDEEREAWRDQMGDEQYNTIIDTFWEEFVAYADELIQQEITERKKWDKMR